LDGEKGPGGTRKGHKNIKKRKRRWKKETAIVINPDHQ
jgi:hypothetical protein